MSSNYFHGIITFFIVYFVEVDKVDLGEVNQWHFWNAFLIQIKSNYVDKITVHEMWPLLQWPRFFNTKEKSRLTISHVACS